MRRRRRRSARIKEKTTHRGILSGGMFSEDEDEERGSEDEERGKDLSNMSEDEEKERKEKKEEAEVHRGENKRPLTEVREID